MPGFWLAFLLAAGGMHAEGSAKPAPAGEFELCRTLERSLRDGELLVVERCWDIRFRETGDATVVEGEPTHVRVDAPAALAPLAAIEERRTESGLFPAFMDEDGLITAPGSETAPASLGETASAALALVRDIRPEGDTADAMNAFVRQVTAASSRFLGQVPRNLFYPAQSNGRQEHALDLPDGSTGSVLIEYSAAHRASDGLLSAASRRIVTSTDAGERVSTERWELREPAS